MTQTFKFKIGLQLYGIQDEFRRDSGDVLGRLADWGCQGIEFLPGMGLDPRALADAMRQCGMEAVGYYAFEPERLADPAGAVYAELEGLGVRHVAVGFPGHVEARWLEAIDRVRRIADVAAGRGVTIHYHNHEPELQRLEGRPALDILAERTDPDRVRFELDTYMLARAGEDPAAWIERFAGRMSRLHVKDLRRSDGAVVAVGTGDLDLGAILTAAARSGIEWLVAEFHPQREQPPLDLARQCLEGLRR